MLKQYRLVKMVGLAVALVSLVSLAYANRASLSYIIPLDDILNGGGASASAHYAVPDSALGQDTPAGFSSSASFQNQAGIVQAWGSGSGPTPTPLQSLHVQVWQDYR